ncbi:MAG TPA: 2Fe-2S iron-sulfur cluster-binding protein [Pyrinomonadaceae bacterium]|nr:2Fe-2S iron-sulfur cluster-binding protein [Pyrinomonadaceae bacterium]
MSVNVEWRGGGEGHAGLVAEGTYLWDAAKRLGVNLPTECGGRGECDTCAVVIEEGATLLSGLTDAERARLSPERLAAGERLACQAKAERAGKLVLRPVPVTERAETTEETARDFRGEFKRMPLRKKLATLVGLEADVAYETILRAAELPFDIVGKGLDLLGMRGHKLAERERAARRPAQPRPAASETNQPSSSQPDDKGPDGDAR